MCEALLEVLLPFRLAGWSCGLVPGKDLEGSRFLSPPFAVQGVFVVLAEEAAEV